MVVHTQHCQFCSSERVRNILVRKAGESDKVFVQCLDCGSFVASYLIAPLGYYHHGKGYESFLRGLHRSGEFMSGRNVQRLYEDRKDQDLEEFQEVLAALQRKRKED